MRKVHCVKGFTLIEIIVVIAIIGILAAILIPSMLAYVRNSKISQYNSNARTVYEGSQLAITDVIKVGNTLEPNTVYICQAEGIGICEDASGNTCDITDYLGEKFGGYFGFMSNVDGTGSVYAVWSEHEITFNNFPDPCMTQDEIKATFSSSSTNPMGCHPQAIDP